ncbi:MAG TPA: DNA primase [Stellaceae bacterium]|nr:DNA primase [Stellaceae bacterium]
MAFPPFFLEELRRRLSLANAVSRRVKLQRRGREFVGLCPFHKEKTPSFSVVEEKGFYHCFGCGAHGDVISFTMQTGSLSFPEAVEALAREAGLEVPKATPEERERAQRQTTLRGALDAAAHWFEEQLHAPVGREALAYLEKRGLDQETIRRFRLGFAPDRRNALKLALGKAFPEPLLVEAGLVRKPTEESEGGGRESYDYFRGRVIFPIADRGGRVIAFGGRTLGDGQPKYLNSPDTPLFEKGRVLYGWAQARAAAGGAGPVIVVEGYMDVIALHRAGFVGAVAPLGTALTERQIEELWRIAPEPTLCFDGDAAGLRAAGRAVDRTLPLLKPGYTLRLATLPEGEDPDTLVLRHGVRAMREILERARPLAEFLWTLESHAGPLDTPERRAALERRLEDRARQIADRAVQGHYLRFFREKTFEIFRNQRFRPGPGPNRGRARRQAPSIPLVEPPPQSPTALARRQEEVLLAVFLNHPHLLGEAAEELAHLEFSAPDLDRLCREILHIHAERPDLDAEGLQLHLSGKGFAATVGSLLAPQVLNHASFARREAEPEVARMGWQQARAQFLRRQYPRQLDDMERGLAEEMTEERWAPVKALQEDREDEDKTIEDLIG